MKTRLSTKRRSPRRRFRQALTIAELLISIVIIATVLVELRLQNIEAMRAFGRSKDNLSGVWMANLMMNELMTSELPNYEAEDGGQDAQGLMTGQGLYSEFLSENFPTMWDDMSEQRQREMELWRYSYSKMVIMVSEEEEGGPDGEFAPILDPEDADESDLDEEDPDYQSPEDRLERPTAQIIRIMLVLTPPGTSQDSPIPDTTKVPVFGLGAEEVRENFEAPPPPPPEELDSEVRAEQTGQRRSHVVLIRFIDVENLRTVINEAAEEAEAEGR